MCSYQFVVWVCTANSATANCNWMWGWVQRAPHPEHGSLTGPRHLRMSPRAYPLMGDADGSHVSHRKTSRSQDTAPGVFALHSFTTNTQRKQATRQRSSGVRNHLTFCKEHKHHRPTAWRFLVCWFAPRRAAEVSILPAIGGWQCTAERSGSAQRAAYAGHGRAIILATTHV